MASQAIIELALKISSNSIFNGLDAAGVVNQLSQNDTRYVGGKISYDDFYNLVDPVERDGLNDPTQVKIWNRLATVNQVDMTPGTNTRSDVDALFASGSNTQNALVAGLSETKTWAQWLGIGKVIGKDIERALAYLGRTNL